MKKREVSCEQECERKEMGESTEVRISSSEKKEQKGRILVGFAIEGNGGKASICDHAQ